MFSVATHAPTSRFQILERLPLPRIPNSRDVVLPDRAIMFGVRYRYEELGDEDFQRLVQALLVREFGHKVRAMPLGMADGGRDAIYGDVVFQVKFTKHPDRVTNPAKELLAMLDAEAGKIKDLADRGWCRSYILATNIEGTGSLGKGTIDKVEEGLKQRAQTWNVDLTVWWRTDVDAHVNAVPDEMVRPFLRMLPPDHQLLLAIRDQAALRTGGSTDGPDRALGDAPAAPAPALKLADDVGGRRAQPEQALPGDDLTTGRPGREQSAAPGPARLQAVNAAEVARRSVQERIESEHKAEIERRKELSVSAKHSLKQISGGLKDAVLRAASLAAESSGGYDGWTISLDQASLQYYTPEYFLCDPFGDIDPRPAFDVVANTAMGIYIPPGPHGYSGFTHSLWYSDAQKAGEFQWFETAFAAMPHHHETRWRGDPFALPPNWAASALCERVSNDYQVAWTFTAIVNDMEGFIKRWTGWFADAVQGQLSRSSTVPRWPPAGSWRRS